MGSSNNNSGWVSGASGIGELNSTNEIDISHYINTVGHPYSIDNNITKTALADTGASGTYIIPDDPHKEAHICGHAIYVS